MATASIYEVASKAGVSTATVSRAFTRPELVSPKTLARVRAAADELNYSITRAATTMKTGQTFRVAILLSDPLSTWFSSSMLDGVNEVLHPAGYDFSIYRIVDTTGRKEFFDTLPIRKNVDAVITSSFGLDATESERLHSIRIPVVGINPTTLEGLDASVGIDDARAATLAAEHLLSLGHTRIAYVRTNPVSSLHYSAQLRADGFYHACMGATRPVTPTVITLSDLPGRMDRCIATLLGMNPGPRPLPARKTTSHCACCSAWRGTVWKCRATSRSSASTTGPMPRMRV